MRVSSDQHSGRRIGVFGGTFDPIHLGHLAVADHALIELSLDCILFIPAARPPHKPDLEITPFIDRVAMLSLAVHDRPEFIVSTMEEKRSGPSYSIDTLKDLCHDLGEKDTLFFLIGMDAFAEIDTWKDFRSLPEICDIVVLDRFPFSFEMMEKITKKFGPYEFSPAVRCWISPVVQGRIHSLPMETVDISSTKIREMGAKRMSLDSMIPAHVAEYIEKKGLFA